MQRERYGKGLAEAGLERFTDGGFYHWGRLPDSQTSDEFNERLFKHEAGFLPGRLHDMARAAEGPSQLDPFIRFSFGPPAAESFDEDMEILSKVFAG